MSTNNEFKKVLQKERPTRKYLLIGGNTLYRWQTSGFTKTHFMPCFRPFRIGHKLKIEFTNRHKLIYLINNDFEVV
jgi:hypothetical protein